MTVTVRSKEGGFAQFLRSHKAMTLLIFTIVCIALYLVKSSFGQMLRPALPPQLGNVVVANEHLLEYFKTGGDAARITWAHAVNNKEHLQNVLKGNTMMLEADVLLDPLGVPIMAHPPDITSNLTLEEFLAETKASSKAIKLDFKTTAAAEAGMKAVSAMKHEMRGRIWLNADIIQGTRAPLPIVDADKLISVASRTCEDCLLSLGWTLGKPDADYKGGYDWDMVKAMHAAVERSQLRQPVTFAVEATYTVLSTQQLGWLLSKTRQSSLTLWFHKLSQATPRDLVCLRERFGKELLYIDMPEGIRKEFDTITSCNTTG